MTRNVLIILLVAAILTSCGGGKAGDGTSARSFPYVEIPAMITSQDQALEYAARHYWDGFFSAEPQFRGDTSLVAGIRDAEFQEAFGKYVKLLSVIPTIKALQAQDTLLARAERAQIAFPDGNLLQNFIDISDLYLFDPNSPLRSEEMYIPVLEKTISSPLTQQAAKDRALHNLPLCSLNRLGTVAADFRYTLKNGRSAMMHSINAPYLLMFFSNPGCQNCKEIIDALSNSLRVKKMMGEGQLVVLNVYPDEDLTAWMDYMPVYPTDWINAFDNEGVLRNDSIYWLRAIPSLYLLDAEKRVICKDAPLDVLLELLEEIAGE